MELIDFLCHETFSLCGVILETYRSISLVLLLLSIVYINFACAIRNQSFEKLLPKESIKFFSRLIIEKMSLSDPQLIEIS